MLDQWCEPLMRCAEGMYVIEEESHRIIWMSDYLVNGIGNHCIGETCWKAFLKRETPCPFCPRLKEDNKVYSWDFYDPHSKRWMKVKHLLFRSEGTLYRAGNVNMIDDLMTLNYETVQHISTLQTVLVEKQDDIKVLAKEAIYDHLTGLYNRNCFHIDLVRDYTNAPGLGVLYFDLNNLKETNDLYRHQAGDALLKLLARALRHTAAHTKNAKCYRIGGDEFVLMLTGCSKHELSNCSQLFHNYLAAYNNHESLTCSVAVGEAFSELPCDPEALVSQADHQMYLEKQKMKKAF